MYNSSERTNDDIVQRRHRRKTLPAAVLLLHQSQSTCGLHLRFPLSALWVGERSKAGGEGEKQPPVRERDEEWSLGNVAIHVTTIVLKNIIK